jgi:hypothetical protein
LERGQRLHAMLLAIITASNVIPFMQSMMARFGS